MTLETLERLGALLIALAALLATWLLDHSQRVICHRCGFQKRRHLVQLADKSWVCMNLWECQDRKEAKCHSTNPIPSNPRQ